MLISGREKRQIAGQKFEISKLARVVIGITTGMVCTSLSANEKYELSDASSNINKSESEKTLEFNSSFIRGVDIDLSRFSQGNPVDPGTYPVLIRLNKLSRGNYMLKFVSEKPGDNAQPCFTQADLQRIGIKPDNEITVSKSDCFFIEKIVKRGSVSYNSSDYELDISVPQINSIKQARGYIDPSLWDNGVTSAFVDYNANYYNSTRGGGRRYTSDNTYLGWLAGINIGSWRIRKRSSSAWATNERLRSQNLYTYAETDIDALKSRLTLGDSNTRGNIFDSVSLRGIQLHSEDKMLPDGYRNFVPVLRGIAETNAKVRIVQRDKVIYETIVPPGEFEIDDIGAMGYGGDLKMIVTEADGRERIQNIPFSAPPMLLHKGISQFGIAAGELRDNRIRKKPKVVQGVYQYGLSNIITPYAGFQIANHYRAAAVGTAFNTLVGGISVDATRAQSELKEGKTSKGNSFSIAYTKHIAPTDTDLVLAAYRYSTKGYLTLSEASLERYGIQDTANLAGFRVRNRLTLNLGQRLWGNTRLTFSGSLYDYWDERPAAKQFAVTFMHPLRYFTYSISAQREFNRFEKAVNTFLFSVNIPLGRQINTQPAFSSIYTSLVHDTTNSTAFQINASGSQGEQNELNYMLGTSAAKYQHGQSQETISGNINYRTPLGSYGLTASANNHAFRQFSLSANGSAVAHRGGITLGPQLGEAPFAIVEAKGATGAKITNGYGTQFDWNGYALMPSLTPYRENNVSVSNFNETNNVDILESQHTVVPRVGSSLFVKMKTIVGAPIMLTVRDEKGSYMPIATRLFDKSGTEKTVVGQSGMAFLRGWNAAEDSLYAKGNDNKNLCHIPVDKSIANKLKENATVVSQLEVVCIR
ncbi:fimbria/pilus outer membrane usher protein [Pantoea sp.]|uniref:fimbria/pilus outer membrane usher protein n=1 Tax=Pantoea sp. TaxID=69393 RepID=UPI0028A227C6|nr:fimbria/pilus outer membrane usher protein [Pantoea sp.]